jgi:hypothetical protein
MGERSKRTGKFVQCGSLWSWSALQPRCRKAGQRSGKRNRPEDVDRETYSMQRCLELLTHGQTVAIDMLFAPDSVVTR